MILGLRGCNPSLKGRYTEGKSGAVEPWAEAVCFLVEAESSVWKLSYSFNASSEGPPPKDCRKSQPKHRLEISLTHEPMGDISYSSYYVVL